MENNKDESIRFILNMKIIQQSKEVPSYIKNASLMLNANGYLLSGEYFANLADSDLEHLIELIERVYHPEPDKYEISQEDKLHCCKIVGLLAILLLYGEGISQPTVAEIQTAMNSLMSMSVVEKMHREGRAQAIHKNYSVTEIDKVIAKLSN